MLKTLGAQIREFKKDSLLTPVFMILEVFMETIIPLMMASIIDQGVEAGNIHHIYVMGAWMGFASENENNMEKICGKSGIHPPRRVQGRRGSRIL